MKKTLLTLALTMVLGHAAHAISASEMNAVMNYGDIKGSDILSIVVDNEKGSEFTVSVKYNAAAGIVSKSLIGNIDTNGGVTLSEAAPDAPQASPVFHQSKYDTQCAK